MEFWQIFLATTCVMVCVYLYFTRNFGYFKKLGIPFVKPIPIFGNMGEILFQLKSPADVIQKLYDCHSDAKYVGFYEFSTPVIFLKDPELVKSIGIKNFDSFPNHKTFTDSSAEPFDKVLFMLKDDAWKDMRALLSPSFSSSKMKIMFKTLSQCAVEFTRHLAKLDPRQSNELEMKDTFGRYTLDVIASVAFGLNVNSMKDTNNEFYRMTKSITDFPGLVIIKFVISMNFPWLAKLLRISIMDRKTLNFFTNIIETTVAIRDAEGIVRPDMIQLMMQARERKEKTALTSANIVAQAFSFLFAGFDSPASTLSFVTHLLALNPDVQRKLQAEVDQVMKKSQVHDGELSYEDLHAMEYLDAVVNETLRLFPPNIVLDRVTSKSFTLPPALPGLEPVQIKPGQNITIPVYSFHHDPKYFSEPEKFDPERFNGDNKSKISPLTYLPFGIGPRICIANRFALMEVKLVLFHLLAKCNILPTPKTQSEIKLKKTGASTALEGGFWVKVEPRVK